MHQLTTQQPSRNPDPTAKARRLAYLIFERADFDRASDFLQDFGLIIVTRDNDQMLLRGTGPAPFCYVILRGDKAGFVGLGYEVEGRVELEKLAAFEGSSPIENVPWPGGGERVSLTDPSGFRIDAIAGQTMADALPYRRPLAINGAEPPTRVNKTQRPPVAPPDIIRLGHLVLEVAAFQATCEWHTRHFGLIPSDVQVLKDGSPAVVFMRLDLGNTPADHHTLALAQGVLPLYSHSAYEVIDTDAVGMGQRVLRERGWQHAWGMGRHVLGSQIFDYWSDPFGDKHEHYTDGDVLTAELPMGIHPVSRQAMSQWGPMMPASFTRPKLTPRGIARMLVSIWHTPDLSFSKVLTLARLFA